MDFSKLANLSIGLAAFLGGLWLVLQIIKSMKRNGPAKSGDIDNSKIAVLESQMEVVKSEIEKLRERIHGDLTLYYLKVDTLWKYVVEAALVDSRQKGVVVANSPVLVTAEVNGQFGALGNRIKEYYVENKLDQMDDNEIVWHLYLAFDQELVDKVCLPYGLNMGQALIAALHICKGEVQTQ